MIARVRPESNNLTKRLAFGRSRQRLHQDSIEGQWLRLLKNGSSPRGGLQLVKVLSCHANKGIKEGPRGRASRGNEHMQVGEARLLEGRRQLKISGVRGAPVSKLGFHKTSGMTAKISPCRAKRIGRTTNESFKLTNLTFGHDQETSHAELPFTTTFTYACTAYKSVEVLSAQVYNSDSLPSCTLSSQPETNTSFSEANPHLSWRNWWSPWESSWPRLPAPCRDSFRGWTA
jgi:hypothetical protein